MPIALAAALAAMLLASTAGAAPAPGRGAALLKLNDAIENERRTLELIRRVPPRLVSAQHRLADARADLWDAALFLGTVAGGGAARTTLFDAWSLDGSAHIWEPNPWDQTRTLESNLRDAAEKLERAIALKRSVLDVIRNAQAPAAAPECGDGKDNDGDGTVDARTDPGCSSPADVRERSRFLCSLSTRWDGTRLVVSGRCSGPFAQADFRVLDSQLSGRYDVKHAPSCGRPAADGFRCTTKDGAQNPRHLVEARLTTTVKGPLQRVAVTMFDARKRKLGRFVALPAPR